jgi:transcriptional regulator with XRE-family HTH domain
MQDLRSSNLLAKFGHRLRQARIAQRQSMAMFARRVGVGESTIRAMERGSPTVRIGAWIAALVALGLDSGDVLSIEQFLSAIDLALTNSHQRFRKRASPPRRSSSPRRGGSSQLY